MFWPPATVRATMNRMCLSFVLVLTLTALVTSATEVPPGKTHRLEATPSAVAYGYYWSEAPSVLRIAPGDILDQTAIETSLRGRVQLTSPRTRR